MEDFTNCTTPQMEETRIGLRPVLEGGRLIYPLSRARDTSPEDAFQSAFIIARIKPAEVFFLLLHYQIGSTTSPPILLTN